jgi:hypothetical protein
VPRYAPVRVACVVSRARAIPKSETFARPFSSSRMLCGFMSRWTTPRPWAWASPAQTSSPTLARSAAGSGPARVYKRLQVPAGEVFHDDVGDLPPVQKVLPRVVDLHDAGVREPRRGAALATEAHPDVRIAVQGLQDLHGHGPVQDLVAAEIDPRHAAPTDLALQNEPVCEPLHARDYRLRWERCRTTPFGARARVCLTARMVRRIPWSEGGRRRGHRRKESINVLYERTLEGWQLRLEDDPLP